MAKIILLSDIHASGKALDSIEQFLQKSQENFSGVIFTGDLLCDGDPAVFADHFIEFIGRIGQSFLWVSGNNDFGEGYERMRREYLPLDELDEVIINGRRFVGVGGSPLLWDLDRTDSSATLRNKIAGSVFLSHYPPRGNFQYAKIDSGLSPADSNTTTPLPDIVGYRPRNITNSPLLHICGHIHSQYGVAHLGQTKIIKLGAANQGHCAILDLASLRVEFLNLF
ncbi:MAG: Calcineurin-like phosphoesterase superfamily domain protein [bacterium ADurb.Bin400]|nr:MAG: Calcineurin-like phosphoesterase superfamily domain protein [bacterium ADurb.Bin400]